jgi:hypothetical protein
MKTVFVYINTAKQLGDVDYVKAFANVEALKGSSRRTTPDSLVMPASENLHNCDIAKPNNNVAQFGTARPCAAPSIRPIFSEGARLEICRDYDIIFVVVVTAGRI